jgi:hypothetical protein
MYSGHGLMWCNCLLVDEVIEYIAHDLYSQFAESNFWPDIYCTQTAHHSPSFHSAEFLSLHGYVL